MSITNRHLLVTLVTVCAVAGIHGQEPRFEAASIKRSTAGHPAVSIGTRPGGRWVMTNGPISSLLRSAFRPEATEIVGAPDWVGSERYDIIATANATTPADQIQAMLRSLLAERFKLVAHVEPREQPVYALVVARPDGRLGPAIRPADRDCAAVDSAVRAGGPAPTLAPPANGAPPCGMQMGGGRLLAGGLTLDVVARTLGSLAGRVTVNKTGLEGYYELTLTYSTPQPGATAAGGDSPDIFTAVQEQLGLRLVPDRAPLATLVIDHIERASEN